VRTLVQYDSGGPGFEHLMSANGARQHDRERSVNQTALVGKYGHQMHIWTCAAGATVQLSIWGEESANGARNSSRAQPDQGYGCL